ncbi:TIR domain-containing protein [Geodermatophilus sp. URMC 63]
MRIAVFGSSKHMAEAESDAEAFAACCRGLGRAMADMPYKVLVESPRPRTADRWVVEGLLTAANPPRAQVWVYLRDKPGQPRPFQDEADEHPGVLRYRPLNERSLAPAHLRMAREADVAIVVGGGEHAYPAGLAAAMMRVRLMPVATFGGAALRLWREFTDDDARRVTCLPKHDTWDMLAGTPQQVLDATTDELRSLPRLMLVHGRSNDRTVITDILQGAGFRVPIVLREQFSPGQTLPEKFEDEALQADAAVVLFTPDDEASALLDPEGHPVAPRELGRRVRARQNVSLECGWFWAQLGRNRVLVLTKGDLELPSDLSGLVYESYVDSPTERTDSLLSFARAIRCG